MGGEEEGGDRLRSNLQEHWPEVQPTVSVSQEDSRGVVFQFGISRYPPKRKDSDLISRVVLGHGDEKQHGTRAWNTGSLDTSFSRVTIIIIIICCNPQ